MSPHQEGSFYAIRGAAKAHNRLHFKLRRWFSYPCPGPTDFNGTVVLAPSRPPSAPLRAGLRPALTSAARDSVSEAGRLRGTVWTSLSKELSLKSASHPHECPARPRPTRCDPAEPRHARAMICHTSQRIATKADRRTPTRLHPAFGLQPGGPRVAEQATC